MFRFTFVLCLATTCCTPLSAQVSDVARSGFLPWSGYWWPHSEGGIEGPLTKYDEANKSDAVSWEQANHPRESAQSWFGFCHAWAASAVCEREPRTARSFANVRFDIGDQKGLLAAIHAEDVANTYGDRYEEGGDLDDIPPDQLWKTLQTYVRSQRVPIVLDMEAGAQVWNYPIYQYSVRLRPLGGNKYSGAMQLVCADNAVRADYVGTQYKVHDYTFEIELEDGAIVMGSGKWTGVSRRDHPDFAWYPYVAVPENPYVEADRVSKIVGYSVGNGGNPPEEPQPPIEPVPPTPVDPPVEPIDPIEPVPTENVLSALDVMEAIVNKTSHFRVDVMAEGAYSEGTTVPIRVISDEPGYLYLFDIHRETGTLRLIYPVDGQNNAIEAKRPYKFGGGEDDAGPALLKASMVGLHDLKAIVSVKRLGITGFSDRKPAKAVDEPAWAELNVHPTLREIIREGLAGKSDVQAKGGAPNQKIAQFGQDRSVYSVLPGKPTQQQQQTVKPAVSK